MRRYEGDERRRGKKMKERRHGEVRRQEKKGREDTRGQDWGERAEKERRGEEKELGVSDKELAFMHEEGIRDPSFCLCKDKEANTEHTSGEIIQGR
ncbi:hypothetical protein GBF38_002506 [Nibea albiflora]|uniref:Uncharacterized protein n=1 Tax=Nibea albiflora TaxID=240163 RepID=A0ACB7EDU7_NIBAL|nr:hypothetical protein GBF38_002506 [Nibea albiflora]